MSQNLSLHEKVDTIKFSRVIQSIARRKLAETYKCGKTNKYSSDFGK